MTEVEWMREFGSNLKNLMKDRNTTQKELAEIAGVSQGTISKYINGSLMPTTKALNKLFYALDCDSYDELIDLGEEIR